MKINREEYVEEICKMPIHPYILCYNCPLHKTRYNHTEHSLNDWGVCKLDEKISPMVLDKKIFTKEEWDFIEEHWLEYLLKNK